MSEPKMTHFKVTFEMTAEHAAEAVVAAGGRCTGDELREMVDCSRVKFRVRRGHTGPFIVSQNANGYHVVNVEVADH
jgi:hypothetical protein